MGHNKESIQYALQTYGDDQTKVGQCLSLYWCYEMFPSLIKERIGLKTRYNFGFEISLILYKVLNLEL
jgi:hypothetical protein